MTASLPCVATLPSGSGLGSSELRYANDLVEFIREETGDHFTLEVAAYPEMHPQASNFEKDLENFVRKVKAGADSAITQYFFNADSYFHFVDPCARHGRGYPDHPGHYADHQLQQAGTLLRWLRGRNSTLDSANSWKAYGDDSDSIVKFGEEGG